MTPTSNVHLPVVGLPMSRTTGARWSRWRPVGLAALVFGFASILYLIRPAVITDDTYAFLDWGRDLRHGLLPLLEQRTFHPLPILAAALVSLLGSAAPTATMLLSLSALTLLAVGAWQLTRRCGFGQPAPLLAAVLVLDNPALLFLGFTAYVNIFFAAFVVWALLAELRGRRMMAWALFIAAALVRPEGWAFLAAYGVLRWWSAGHPLAPRRWLAPLVLVVAPPLVWVLLEWRLFGDPLYSFHVTTIPAVKPTGSGSLAGIFSTLRSWIGIPALLASALGVVALARLAPPRVAVRVIGATAVAAATIGLLSLSNFNVPSRHYSVLATMICVLAAAGASTPAILLGKRWGKRAALAASSATAVLLIGLSILATAARQSTDFHFLRVRYDTSRSLDRSLASVRRLIDARGARPHTVASFDYTEVSWDLGAQANVAAAGAFATTRVILQPSAGSDDELATITRSVHLRPAPPGWRVLYRGAWTIYAAGAIPISLARR